MNEPGRPGRPRPDLGPIYAGNRVLWGWRCLDGCRDGAPIGLSKARATAAARRHVAAKPTHRCGLQAITTQTVYGSEAR